VPEDPGCNVHGDAANIVTTELDFTGVESCPHF
jgi:hypothetical protein